MNCNFSNRSSSPPWFLLVCVIINFVSVPKLICFSSNCFIFFMNQWMGLHQSTFSSFSGVSGGQEICSPWLSGQECAVRVQQSGESLWLWPVSRHLQRQPVPQNHQRQAATEMDGHRVTKGSHLHHSEWCLVLRYSDVGDHHHG